MSRRAAELAERPPRREALGLPRNLAVLWTFAVAQPLFDLLKDNPEFFAARGSSGFDIISFSVLLVVAAAAAAARRSSCWSGWPAPGVRQVAHLVLLGGARRR